MMPGAGCTPKYRAVGSAGTQGGKIFLPGFTLPYPFEDSFAFMDLGFSLNPYGWASFERVSLADIKAEADRRRLDSATGWSVEGLPVGKDRREAVDWVHILACRLVPGHGGPTDAAPLGGSFNPAVAGQLMVGDRVKAALTSRL